MHLQNELVEKEVFVCSCVRWWWWGVCGGGGAANHLLRALSLDGDRGGANSVHDCQGARGVGGKGGMLVSSFICVQPSLCV